MAARALVLHAPEGSQPQSDRIGDSRRVLSRDRDHDRQVYGAMLREARGPRLSLRALADSIGVSHATLDRWESGEQSAPLDLINRLPPDVAARLSALIASRVEARECPLSAQEIDRSVDRSIGLLMVARAEGRVDAAALLALEHAARRAAGRASGGER